jgi:putative endonuclease
MAHECSDNRNAGTCMNECWIVYMLQCADRSLYTGITKHANGTGAKYTKGRGPYTVMLREEHPSKSAALKRELAIKRLSKAQKLQLCGSAL